MMRQLPGWKDIKLFLREWWFSTYVIVLLLGLGVLGYQMRVYYGQPHPYDQYVTSQQPHYKYTEEALRVKSELENELNSLKPLPNAIYQPIQSYGGNTKWWVYCSFETKLDLFSVAKHYEAQLASSNGWHHSSGYLRVGGQERYLAYSKGPYILEFEKSEYLSNIYSMRLSWQKSNEENPWIRLAGMIFVLIACPILIFHSWRSLYRRIRGT